MDLLVGVIALSEKRCSFPIDGLLAYATDRNFLGQVVRGYEAHDVCLLTKKAAEALCKVQEDLVKEGLGLFLFDAYRPLKAVRHFIEWFAAPSLGLYEEKRKKTTIQGSAKRDLPILGYAPKDVSSHCFAFSIDLTLQDLATKTLLDMGTEFDYFGPESHLDVPKKVIGEKACLHRNKLIIAMEKHGFFPYPLEWWHFDYQEPEIKDPLDIDIVSSLKNLGVT